MTSDPSAQTAISPPDRFWRLVARLLAIGMILVLLPGLILIIEMGIPVMVLPHLPSAMQGDPAWYTLRGASYLLLFAGGAWLVYRFSRPQRRRLYWILLGIGALLMAPPTGVFFSLFLSAVFFFRGAS